MGDGLSGGELHLLAGGQVLHGAHAGGDLILPQEYGVGDGQLIGVGDLLLELLLLGVDLGADAGLPQLGSQGDGGGEVIGHGQDEHIGGGGVQAVVEIALVLQNEEQAGQTDGNSHAGELFFGIIFR